MTVIDMNEFKKGKKTKSTNKTQPANKTSKVQSDKKVVPFKKTDEKKIVVLENPPNDLKNSSYYFTTMGATVSFGGAFARNLLENKEKQKEGISKILERSNEITEENLELFSEHEPEAYAKIAGSIRKQNTLMQDILHKIKTQEEFDEMFSAGSDYLSVVGFVLTIIMVQSYSELDYHRMIKNKWLIIDKPVEEFMNLPIYKEIKKIYSENKN